MRQFPEIEGPAKGPESDGEVVARVLGGDRDAYRTLVRRYQDTLFGHALRLTADRDTAADLTQAALVKAYTELRRCREPERFGAWLFRILSNACKDHLKSRRRRDVTLDDARAGNAPGRSDPGLEVERAELGAALQSALARLPDALREAFLLKHVEGMPYEEMTVLLGVSIPALKMRVHRAREALKAMLEEVL